MSLVLAIGLCPFTAYAGTVRSLAAGIANGSGETWGGIYWKIDADGCLTISPADEPMNNAKPGAIPANMYDSSTFDSSDVEHFWRWQTEALKSKITSIKIEPGVTLEGSAERMFSNLQKLESVDMSGFDTSHVTNMSSMFRGCYYLSSLNLSHFVTSEVTDMSSMFFQVGSWAASTDIDVSSFDTSHVSDASSMFYDCRNVKSLDVSGFDTSNMTSVRGMFAGCSSLTELDLSSFDTSGVGNGKGFLPGGSIENLTLGEKTKLSQDCGLTGKSLGGELVDVWALSDGSRLFSTEGPIAASGSASTAGKWILGGKGQLEKATVVVGAKSVVHDGKKKQPSVVVKLGGNTLDAGADYSIAYKNNTNAGTASVTVTGMGNYEGAKSATFSIAPASLSKAVVALKTKSFAYNGKARTPAVTSAKLSGKTLKAGADYYKIDGKNSFYKNNVKPGTATLTLKGKGNYAGSTVVAKFAITKLANTLVASGKTATVQLSKLKRANQTVARAKAISVSKAKGAVSYKKAGRGNAKITVNPKNGNIVVKKGLKAGTYKVKVNVTAAGNAYYKAMTKSPTVVVRVK